MNKWVDKKKTTRKDFILRSFWKKKNKKWSACMERLNYSLIPLSHEAMKWAEPKTKKGFTSV